MDPKSCILGCYVTILVLLYIGNVESKAVDLGTAGVYYVLLPDHHYNLRSEPSTNVIKVASLHTAERKRVKRRSRGFSMFMNDDVVARAVDDIDTSNMKIPFITLNNRKTSTTKKPN